MQITIADTNQELITALARIIDTNVVAVLLRVQLLVFLLKGPWVRSLVSDATVTARFLFFHKIIYLCCLKSHSYIAGSV